MFFRSRNEMDHGVFARALYQNGLSFQKNIANIIGSLVIARDRGCIFRTGPDLKATGYGCLDHFFESGNTVLLLAAS